MKRAATNASIVTGTESSSITGTGDGKGRGRFWLSLNWGGAKPPPRPPRERPACGLLAIGALELLLLASCSSNPNPKDYRFPPPELEPKLVVFGILSEADEKYFNEQFAAVIGV